MLVVQPPTFHITINVPGPAGIGETWEDARGIRLGDIVDAAARLRRKQEWVYSWSCANNVEFGVGKVFFWTW